MRGRKRKEKEIASLSEREGAGDGERGILRERGKGNEIKAIVR